MACFTNVIRVWGFACGASTCPQIVETAIHAVNVGSKSPLCVPLCLKKVALKSDKWQPQQFQTCSVEAATHRFIPPAQRPSSQNAINVSPSYACSDVFVSCALRKIPSNDLYEEQAAFDRMPNLPLRCGMLIYSPSSAILLIYSPVQTRLPRDMIPVR